MKSMQISVIIVNYNTEQLTLDCLKSIYEHTIEVDFEIIIVDNASSDNSVEAIKASYPLVKVIESNKNLGFGRANNLGAKYAQGEYLFLLNSDTLLIENTLSVLYTFMKDRESENIGACGVSLLNGQQQKTISAGHFPSLLQEFSDIGFRHLYKNYYNNNLSLAFSIPKDEDVKEVDYICGADIFIKELFNELKGFDEDYFMYFEETDLFFRLKSKGYSSVILTNHHLIHLEGGSTVQKETKWSLKKYQMLMNSKILYYKKHKSFFALFLMKIFNTLFTTIHPIYKGNRLNIYKTIWQ